MNKVFIILLIQIILIPASQTLAATCNYNSPGYIVNRFTDNNDGTVYDNFTGLTWQRCIMGKNWSAEYKICGRDIDPVKHDWKTALDNVLTFNNAEFSKGRLYDWRLPNIKELASIINLNCFNPALDTSVFLIDQSYLWSSTPSATVGSHILNNTGTTYVYENYVWSMSLVTGREIKEPWSIEKAVLLVRGISE